MLRNRLLVAAVGLPIGLAAIVLGTYFILGLAVILTVIGLHEYYTILRPYRPNLLVGYLSGLGCIAGAFFLKTAHPFAHRGAAHLILGRRLRDGAGGG